MARVLLVTPWLYTDENVVSHDLSHEWRNGPYSLLILAAQLLKNGHSVQIADLACSLVKCNGNVTACLQLFEQQIVAFRPEIIGFSFFSVHYFEIQKALNFSKSVCEANSLSPLFIAGGIHASIEPISTLKELGFDCIVVGEGDSAIVDLANGGNPDDIPGVYTGRKPPERITLSIKKLDDIPFIPWHLIDHSFYSHPTYARIGVRKSSSLDIMISRGCGFRCSFCAYSTLSHLRYHSVDYIINHIRHMISNYGINGFYFLDSTIGTNRKLLISLCEALIIEREHIDFEWYANIRADQVDENLLRLMWQAGCRYLFYGFESGSQRILDKMNKRISVEQNYAVAEMHNRLKFPYNASMIVGFPGETEDDIMQTFMFLVRTTPPRVGINWYVPLPGSDDYEVLKRQGKITIFNPRDWRGWGCIGEKARIFADVPEERFRQLYNQLTSYVNNELKQISKSQWEYI